MTEDLISIGRMAEINHVSVPTLRLYDQLNLLKPIQVNEQTGYRYYSIRQNARLDMIQYMKELGMSLDEISSILSKEDIRLIEEILIRKREQLFEEIRRLKQRREAISRAIAGIERYRKSPTSGTLSLEYIDRRRIFSIPSEINFYDYNIDTYEQTLNRLRETLLSNHFPQAYDYNVGTSISAENFKAQQFVADQIFLFVDPNFPSRSEVRILDGGMYACIYLEHYDDEVECAGKLLHFCQQNEYVISGDYICEVLTEFNVFDSSERSMFLRLQVPVSFQK
ncbi:MAG: helix-turn-helix domain-containing protein [Eubacteriales bacterium]|nr:helix-turn-helix domain-containing protein [Eubacteriales bacterium]